MSAKRQRKKRKSSRQAGSGGSQRQAGRGRITTVRALEKNTRTPANINISFYDKKVNGLYSLTKKIDETQSAQSSHLQVSKFPCPASAGTRRACKTNR